MFLNLFHSAQINLKSLTPETNPINFTRVSDYVLVTGAAGFIGARLVERLLHDGTNVIALDCFLPDLYPVEAKLRRWEGFDSLNFKAELIKIVFDLRSNDFAILEGYNIRSVYNLAAMPGLKPNWGEFRTYYDCNLYALNRLLEFSKNLELTSFVQASTSSDYGRNAVGDESHDLSPVSPYGVSKLAGEKLLIAYWERFNTPVKILRYFSVYGPQQRPDMAYSKIIDALKKDRVFSIFGDGMQRRSNTFVDDVIEATILASEKAVPGEILNICGDETISLNEAISIIESLIGRNLKREFLPPRPGDQVITSGINSRAKNSLGWVAKTPISRGLALQVRASE